MDMMGKAMFSHQVNKIKGDFGFGDEDDEKKEESNYDPAKEADEEAKLADQRARRKEEHGKRQADRAANRNKIREKYGLKESKHDQQLTTPSGAAPKAPSGDSSSLSRKSPSEEKKDEKCSVM